MSDGVKTQLDRVCHALRRRRGPLSSLYDITGQFPPLLERPTTGERVEEAERLLGFALPALLKAVYLRVANGGEALFLVGIQPSARRPGFPSVPLCDIGTGYFTEAAGFHTLPLRDIVAGYFTEVEGFPACYGEPWPAGRVPIFAGHGCSLVSCIDCTAPEGPVWLVNEGRWELTHPTLADYLIEAITTWDISG